LAHLHQLKFVSLVDEYFVKRHRPDVSILEVGSYDVNGSVRQIFPDCKYIGADLCEGPGVDLVRSGHEIDFPDGSFDIAISCECFEHNPDWFATFLNMHRMTKPGGLLIMTCASKGRLEHGTPRAIFDSSPGASSRGLDYYRNLTEKDFTDAIKLDQLFAAHRFFYIRRSCDLYFLGWKIDLTPFKGDLDKFCRDVEKINNLGKTRVKIFDIPVSLARHLDMDDKAFQDFACSYLAAVRPIRDFIKSLSRWHK
jgi:SAM-dependent methyltransferase